MMRAMEDETDDQPRGEPRDEPRDEPRGDAELLTRKSVYPGRTVRLFLERVRLPNGHVTELEIVHHPGAACIVPFVTPDEVLLIRQYRWAAGGWLLEAPAGKLDPGEEPERCATRELEEETGHRPGRLESLGSILTSPGFCDETIHLYAAFDLEEGLQATEDGEVLSVERIRFDDALAMTSDGRIRDVKTIAVLHLALAARARG